MPEKFSFEDVAGDVLNEYGQADSFEQRFIGFCENALDGKAEDQDLERLIENVELPNGGDDET